MALNETLNILLGILTLIAGGGWFVNWKATRRRSDAEVTQQEAVGWKAMQEVYEKHFEDMQLITDSVREDRDRLKEDKDMLYKENREWRSRYADMENQIMDLKRDMARLGRRLERVLPFTCGVVKCSRRQVVEMKDPELEEQKQQMQ